MNQDIEPQLIKSNVAIHTSDAPEIYGDGSLEVQGQIYTDTIVEYTTNNGVSLSGLLANNSTLLFTPQSSNNVISSNNGIIIFNDSNSDQIRYKYSNGSLNPILVTKGSLFTHNGTVNTVLDTSNTTDGNLLTIDSTAANGIAWKTPFVLQSALFFTTSLPQSSTNATIFV